MTCTRVKTLEQFCKRLAQELGLPSTRVWAVPDHSSTYASGRIVVSRDRLGERRLGYYHFVFYNDDLLSISQWVQETDMTSLSQYVMETVR